MLQYRIFLNGFGYALFGVPAGDLESVWRNDRPTPQMRPPEQQRRVLIPPHSVSLTYMVNHNCVHNELHINYLLNYFVVRRM